MTDAEGMTPEEAFAEVIGRSGTQAKRLVVPRRMRVYINFESATGELLQGTAVYEVPDEGRRRAIGLTAAKLRGSVPLAALDDYTIQLVLRQAYLMGTLVEVPEWMKMDRFIDPKLSSWLYEEGLAHEARFLEQGGDRGSRTEPDFESEISATGGVGEEEPDPGEG